jgi:hypothetical protein
MSNRKSEARVYFPVQAAPGWIAPRNPDTYRDIEGALDESRRLNEWIEAVLAASPSGRGRAVAGGADTVVSRRHGAAPPRALAGFEPTGRGAVATFDGSS